MEAITFSIVLIIFKQDLMKIGEYHSDVRSLSCGIISHSTRLDQPCEQKYLMDYNYTLFN